MGPFLSFETLTNASLYGWRLFFLGLFAGFFLQISQGGLWIWGIFKNFSLSQLDLLNYPLMLGSFFLMMSPLLDRYVKSSNFALSFSLFSTREPNSKNFFWHFVVFLSGTIFVTLGIIPFLGKFFLFLLSILSGLRILLDLGIIRAQAQHLSSDFWGRNEFFSLTGYKLGMLGAYYAALCGGANFSKFPFSFGLGYFLFGCTLIFASLFFFFQHLSHLRQIHFFQNLNLCIRGIFSFKIRKLLVSKSFRRPFKIFFSKKLLALGGWMALAQIPDGMLLWCHDFFLQHLHFQPWERFELKASDFILQTVGGAWVAWKLKQTSFSTMIQGFAFLNVGITGMFLLAIQLDLPPNILATAYLGLRLSFGISLIATLSAQLFLTLPSFPLTSLAFFLGSGQAGSCLGTLRSGYIVERYGWSCFFTLLLIFHVFFAFWTWKKFKKSN